MQCNFSASDFEFDRSFSPQWKLICHDGRFGLEQCMGALTLTVYLATTDDHEVTVWAKVHNSGGSWVVLEDSQWDNAVKDLIKDDVTLEEAEDEADELFAVTDDAGMLAQYPIRRLIDSAVRHLQALMYVVDIEVK